MMQDVAAYLFSAWTPTVLWATVLSGLLVGGMWLNRLRHGGSWPTERFARTVFWTGVVLSSTFWVAQVVDTAAQGSADMSRVVSRWLLSLVFSAAVAVG